MVGLIEEVPADSSDKLADPQNADVLRYTGQ